MSTTQNLAYHLLHALLVQWQRHHLPSRASLPPKVNQFVEQVNCYTQLRFRALYLVMVCMIKELI
jgi:hypothetical protein